MSEQITENRPPLWRRLIGYMIGAAILAVAAWKILTFSPPMPDAKKLMAMMSGGDTGPMPVQVETILPTTVPVTLEYLGQTEAYQKVEVRARVAGFLQKRLFDEGALVRQGQELFRLEPDTFEADVAAAKAALAQSQATCEQAQREVKRYQDLQTAGAATVKELDDQQILLRVCQANVLVNEARLRQAKLSLDYTVLHSPLTGVVGKAIKDVGSYLNPQTDAPLVLVQQVDPIYIQFPITERDLLRWRALADSNGQKTIQVDLTLPDGKPFAHQGKVNFVDVNVEPRTGTAMVRAQLANPEGVLRPGQLLRVKVAGLQRKDVLTVPQQAVVQVTGGAMVYVVSEQDEVKTLPVTLGEWVADRWIVEQGLPAGTRVIVDHLTKLKPGVKVQVGGTPKATTAPAK